MLEKSREKSVKDAIAFLKRCPYKGTAIKVELEAQLNRGDNGSAYGGCCDDCHSEGTINGVTCGLCDGVGTVYNSHDFSDEEACETYIEGVVSQEAKDALIYGKFYYDGSVDSEYTFTVPIDKPHIVIEYINAFNKLARKINPTGPAMNVEGAGMHIAILNSTDGAYPRGCKTNRKRCDNFASSMSHLIPALYFLSSCDHTSRTLRFRQPRILNGYTNNKYSAIAERNGVLEFRCFETCYQKPEAFLDYFCVIAKAFKFYNLKPVTLPFFDTIGKLGMKDGFGLSRFYYTTRHLEALEKGVAVLKPDYKTFEEMKRERNLKLTPSKLLSTERKLESKWRQEFKEFKERKDYGLEHQRTLLEDEWKRMVGYDGADYVVRNYGPKKTWLTTHLVDYASRHPDTEEAYVQKKHEDYSTADVSFTVNV